MKTKDEFKAMQISFLIEEMEKNGVVFSLADGKIRVAASNPKALDPEVVSALRERKPEAISYLESRKSCFANLQSLGVAKLQNRNSESDPYSERLQAALDGICQPDYPAGMVPWLGDSCPELYSQLTSLLPDELSRLWCDGAPIEHFDRVLAIWKEAHRTACEMYGKAKSHG